LKCSLASPIYSKIIISSLEQNRKTRGGRGGIWGASKKTAKSSEVEKKTGGEVEKILEKLEEMKEEITGM
jgi:hypothetical protein